MEEQDVAGSMPRERKHPGLLEFPLSYKDTSLVRELPQF
jgi:hypothetical protein